MNNVESYGDKEYALCLKKALKEALDENQRVSQNVLNNINMIKIQMSEQIKKMEKEIAELKLENKEKEDALLELGQFYDVRI